MKAILSVVFIVLLVGAGCSHFDSEARKHSIGKDDAYWFDYTANRRGAIIVFQNNSATGMRQVAYLAEPSPDSAKQIMDDFSAKVSYKDLGVEAKAKLADQIVQLAKRSQTVQFLRESMYRLSELSLNGNLDKAEMKELYIKVLDAAILMAGIEFQEAEKGAAEAKKALTNAEIELKKIEMDTSTFMKEKKAPN